jgi:proteasome assembly chaperone 2
VSLTRITTIYSFGSMNFIPVRTPTYQLRPTNGPSLASTALESLMSLPIPTYTSPVQQQPQEGAERSAISFIPGGGLTRRILSSFPAGWTIPTAGLLQFVLEGDNQADAGLLASVVVKVVGKDITQWKQPGSWRDGLFGTPHDQSLYG